MLKLNKYKGGNQVFNCTNFLASAWHNKYNMVAYMHGPVDVVISYWAHAT